MIENSIAWPSIARRSSRACVARSAFERSAPLRISAGCFGGLGHPDQGMNPSAPPSSLPIGLFCELRLFFVPRFPPASSYLQHDRDVLVVAVAIAAIAPVAAPVAAAVVAAAIVVLVASEISTNVEAVGLDSLQALATIVDPFLPASEMPSHHPIDPS